MNQQLPKIIQGGMGAGVSNWRLAQAVSRTGQLGVVSGTALDQILARRLQDGDEGGHMRRALEHFPVPAIAERILATYYIAGGKAASQPYKGITMHSLQSPRPVTELFMAANFVEVWLAREGHDHPVGINYLEKVQMAHLSSIYGAMLAGVGYVLMGAGIPTKIPAVLDHFALHQPASYPVRVSGGEEVVMQFDPAEYTGGTLAPLVRPKFLAIVSSNVLAATIAKRANGRVDGFIVEDHTAGGHNAPPRGKQPEGLPEPIYGERDQVDLAKLADVGLPFWLAGSRASAAKLHEALAAGAAGVQVGTAFAFCNESGLREDYKHTVLAETAEGGTRVHTDPLASPTSFPFKTAQLAGTIAEPAVYEARPRVCDLGYLREPVLSTEGRLQYRCSAEPVASYVAKSGDAQATVGRKCLCNALLANIGLPQLREDKYEERGLVTAGAELNGVSGFVHEGETGYTAESVVEAILARE